MAVTRAGGGKRSIDARLPEKSGKVGELCDEWLAKCCCKRTIAEVRVEAAWAVGCDNEERSCNGEGDHEKDREEGFYLETKLKTCKNYNKMSLNQVTKWKEKEKTGRNKETRNYQVHISSFLQKRSGTTNIIERGGMRLDNGL
jgi:hypothetical protein